MKRVTCIILLVLAICCAGLPAVYAASNENADYLVGDWSTSDGVQLSFYSDGSYEMAWGWLLSESGRWHVEDISSNSFKIEMEGSAILSIMSLVYGSANSNYHFEILKCNQNNFYLVQVYGDYTATTSKCKLGFTRDGCKRDFTIKAPDPKPVIHTVHSGSGNDDLSFTFKAKEEIEDLVREGSSYDYDPRLAHFLSIMARSAYDETIIKKNYEELGLKKPKTYHYANDEFAGHVIGKKTLSDGTELVMITVRGSYGDFFESDDWQKTNFNSFFDPSSDNYLKMEALADDRGWHAGFSRSAEQVLKDLKSFMGGSLKKKKVVYVITGHSLGAGVGNLLATRLYEEGVPSGAVYDYNFACPNTAVGKADIKVWNPDGAHNNIINVGNWCDMVTHVPTNDAFNFSDTRWKRYGQSYWFTTGYSGAILRTVDQNPLEAHDMKTYIEYTSRENDASQFIDTEYVVNVVSARCPVDLTVYNSEGRPIAGTVGGRVDYYDREPGENALILLDGDQKFIYLFGEDQFRIHVKATDDGKMDYSIGQMDLLSGNIRSRKDFSSVSLTAGKEMSNTFGKDMVLDDSELLVVDKDGVSLAKVSTDGSEVSVKPAGFFQKIGSFLPWKYIAIAIGALFIIVIIVIILSRRPRRR